jgi:hypothetical protein
MEAMCINDNFRMAKAAGVYCPQLGEIVEIIKEMIDPKWGLYYVLEKGPKDWGYDADKFAPLSDIDETKMIRETQTQTA